MSEFENLVAAILCDEPISSYTPSPPSLSNPRYLSITAPPFDSISSSTPPPPLWKFVLILRRHASTTAVLVLRASTAALQVCSLSPRLCHRYGQFEFVLRVSAATPHSSLRCFTFLPQSSLHQRSGFRVHYCELPPTPSRALFSTSIRVVCDLVSKCLKSFIIQIAKPPFINLRLTFPSPPLSVRPPLSLLLPSSSHRLPVYPPTHLMRST
jgi:hypothetical protein